ncbi:MAG: dockerin type I repeat-containing protein [Clostridia bacterium]|nr:dockerin type I repeat-containing protein [Clostridia bacterium]
MKKYIKILSLALAMILTLGGVSLISAGAESGYVQPEKFIYGDVDLDGDVTIKDATLIQKGLAKVTYVNAVQRYLADPEGTGYSIKNATAIQKFLAKYEASPLFGTELVMTTENKFSSGVSTDSDYVLDEIIVRVKAGSNQEYTLEDFPEYNFSKVVKCEYNDSRYYLYLENSGKENIIEALRALDYRANIDLVSASASFIQTQD